MKAQVFAEPASDVVDCDLCILGAGIAGLNALFAASRRLAEYPKIVMVDRQAGPAGMWNGVYDYVRLHQPHRFFTVGNIEWQTRRPSHYLATKGEVCDHLQYCYEVLRERTRLDARFGHEYLAHEERADERGVRVRCRRLSDSSEVTIRARRVVKAFGYDIRPMPELALSSKAVVSLSPDQSHPRELQSLGSKAPVYVVGGGKTGMDTAHTLITRAPGTSVRLLVGAGTVFMDRDRLAPRGLRRHWGGTTPLEAFLDVASRFDGRNEIEVMRHLRRRYGVSLDDGCRRFMFGILSPAENRAIRNGAAEIIRGHLQDVIDTPRGPQLLLRSGERRPVPPGSIFVNATGYLARASMPHEPYLSSRGSVLSIQPTSAIHFLSSQAAYFMTHLFLAGDLASLPLYEADLAELRDASQDVFPAAGIALVIYNMSVILGRLPRWVMNEDGLDTTRLFPLHRRLLALGKLLAYLKLHPNHLRSALDVVRQRLGVRLGPLQTTRA